MEIEQFKNDWLAAVLRGIKAGTPSHPPGPTCAQALNLTAVSSLYLV